MNKNLVTLTVVVNGKPVGVDVNPNAPLHTIIPKALEKSGNPGQPPVNWELRDASGNPFDLNKKIEEYEFSEDTKLFLNLKAGIGG